MCVNQYQLYFIIMFYLALEKSFLWTTQAHTGVFSWVFPLNFMLWYSEHMTANKGPFWNSIKGLTGYQPVSVKKRWNNNYTIISLWSPTHSGANPPYFMHGSESAKIFKNIHTLFLGFGCNGAVCLKKDPTIYVFGFSPFWNLNFDKSEVIVRRNFWYFQNEIWQDGPFLVLEN